MTKIEFSDEQGRAIRREIQKYLHDEFSLEIGQFEAGFFLEFIQKRLGPYYYNQGLKDALLVLQKQSDSVAEEIYGLEKAVESQEIERP